MNFAQARFNMIEQQIRPWNVLDAAVLELLSTVPREDFVPEAHKALAFADLEIPLPGGQCMLAPRLEARMLQDLALQPHESVLEVGAGSGFMAALLSHRARQVLSVELLPELVELARSNLQKAGIRNVTVRQEDGAKLPAGEGTFDAIVLSGSVARVPHDLLQRLNVGGRLLAIVGEEPQMRATLITRTSATDFRTTEPWDVNAPRLQNFAEPSRFQF
ncbi:protein-L-isoaspartate O-methyltransferase [uncultured Rhodoferax sp.]|uniref:protein-L-isoaspartate O-methyltransferase family protein n=1 Tax=uncultured Rhodoferax sp. TaxID=223188 RepID=UPI0025F0015C|nr:protein-L-isoaspartate O-methyltransferase [uncultured Rhodoferax sp.]